MPHLSDDEDEEDDDFLHGDLEEEDFPVRGEQSLNF